MKSLCKCFPCSLRKVWCKGKAEKYWRQCINIAESFQKRIKNNSTHYKASRQQLDKLNWVTAHENWRNRPHNFVSWDDPAKIEQKLHLHYGDTFENSDYLCYHWEHIGEDTEGIQYTWIGMWTDWDTNGFCTFYYWFWGLVLSANS